MLKRKPEYIHFLLLFLLVFLTYQESLNNYFLADDALWISRARSVNEHVLNVFVPVGRYLRPAVTFVIFILYKFFGLEPMPYYIFSILLHFLNTLCVYYLCLKLTETVFKKGRQDIAFLSAVFFCVLYVHSEAVIWLGAMGDSLVCFFGLLSFIFFIQFLFAVHRKNVYYVTSFLFFLLSLLSKENAFLLPFIFVVYCYFFSMRKEIFLLPYFATCFAYFLIYRAINPSLGEGFFGGYQTLKSLINALVILVKSFFGFTRNIAWVLEDVNVELFSTMKWFQVPMMICFFIYLIFFIKHRKKNTGEFLYARALLFCALFIVLAYLPVALFIPPEHAPTDVSQKSLRYFYLPSVGFCIGIALIVSLMFEACKSFTLKIVFVLATIYVNLIPIYQTQWSYNYFGRTRKLIIFSVIELHKNYKNNTVVFLVGYPRLQVNSHLFASTLSPLFELYDLKTFFVWDAGTILKEIKNFTLDKICFFEWEGITFIDRTSEYRRIIKQRLQTPEKVKAHSKASNHKNKRP